MGPREINRSLILSVLFLGLLVLVAITTGWMWNPIFSATYIDIPAVGGIAPFSSADHLLGTDLVGRDVLAGVIAGCSTTVMIPLVTIVFALIFAYAFSIFTSFPGDKTIKMNVFQIVSFFIFSFIAYYYTIVASPVILGFDIYIWLRLLLFTISLVVSFYVSTEIFNTKKMRSFYIPLDGIGNKIYELYTSIPSLIVLLIFVGLSPKTGPITLALTLSILIWPSLYRYIRIEMLKEKSSELFLSLKNLGYSDQKILINHIIPATWRPLLTPVIFMMISIIVTEATLSFLGLGLSDDVITWGKLLAQARTRLDAWWLAVIPGTLIFTTLLSLHNIGKYISDKKRFL